MAIKLIANYAKRLGLPGYSSHQFSVSVETELHDVTNIAAESSKLYETLQQSVDEQIQTTGFVPPEGYGMENNPQPRENGHGNGNPGISDKQLDLINKIVRENNVSKNDVETLSVELFGGGIRTLNKMQASNLIDELFDRYGKKNGSKSRFPQREVTRR